MEQHEKVILDGIAVLVGGLSVFWSSVPTLAALAALIYTILRIPETEIYKKWTRKK